MQTATFRVAHISDLHIPPLPRLGAGDLLGKRALGLVSWHRKWRAEHRMEILDALVSQLRELAPDHICVTGDLTFTTHPTEVDAARTWLQHLADRERISVIPGNHDAYVRGSLDYVLRCWAPWMHDDAGARAFPFVHRRGPVDIIGLSSAVATLPGLSLGRVGEAQLTRLEELLAQPQDPGRYRLLLIHHPLQDGAAREARALADRRALRAVLARRPVDLVLHGHLHRPVATGVPGPAAPIPVLGAASASTLGNRYTPAHYHLLEFAGSPGPRAVRVRHAHYSPDAGTFVLGESEAISSNQACRA